MKFGALLRTSAREMPELQGLFNCYKQLKKRLKRLPGKTAQLGRIAPDLQGSSALLAHERAFVALLVSDIQAFNETYVEKEEQSVIRLSLLEERFNQAEQESQKAALYQDFVNFHGQTLMLVHWSILAYTSVLKILKKHHKRTGLQVQEFSMRQLLSQPFCSVDLISELVKKAEAKAQELAAALNIAPAKTSASFASRHSSPVAGELMTAARETVQGISDSAARGNEALEEHITAQPSSSEEGSIDLGEAEVVSSRNTAASPAPGKLDSVPLGARSSRNTLTPNNLRVNTNGRKRPRPDGGSNRTSSEGRIQAKREKWSSVEENNAILPQAQKTCNCKQIGKLAVDGNSHVPFRDASPISHQGARTEAESQVGDRGVLKTSESSQPSKSEHSASTGSKSRSRSQALTMGQGWAGGTSENILQQTRMALGLWEQLHVTASTPSTVVPPLQPSRPPNVHQDPANSAA